MGIQEAYCSICGGPFGIYEPEDGWTESAYLLILCGIDDTGKLSGIDDEEPPIPEMTRLIRIPAEHDDMRYFREHLSGELDRIQVLWTDVDHKSKEARHPLYIPVHQGCMQMVDQLIEQRRTLTENPPDSIVDDWSFWRVLRSRFDENADFHGFMSTGCLPEPLNYLGATRFQHNEWEDEPGHELFEANPNDPRAIERMNAGHIDESATDRIGLCIRNRRRIRKLIESARIGDNLSNSLPHGDGGGVTLYIAGHFPSNWQVPPWFPTMSPERLDKKIGLV